MESGDPQLALAHTIEVQNPAGRTTGLVVLPSHPLRVAWQSAYDELAYGLAMIVASQEAKDFDSSLYSAIANYLILRVTDQDARTLARNVAPSEIERRTADRLKTLPKYEALFFSEGQRQPIHLHLPS